jgi:Fe-Mn family superoxide dismutase
MKYELPLLSYPYDALEPYIDAQTMEIHHTKHHQTYVTKLNEALAKHPSFASSFVKTSEDKKATEGKPELKSLEELLSKLESVPEDIRTAVKNHGGGHFSHSLFWRIMAPPFQPSQPGLLRRSRPHKATEGKGGEPQGRLAGSIAAAFGGFAKFKESFSSAASGVFGSGWAWLALSPSKGLLIMTTPNQDSPVTNGLMPILCLDVWEHAYYLKYRNRRPEYIEAWWNVVNWAEVNNNLERSRK